MRNIIAKNLVFTHLSSPYAESVSSRVSTSTTGCAAGAMCGSSAIPDRLADSASMVPLPGWYGLRREGCGNGVYLLILSALDHIEACEGGQSCNNMGE
jgi:hypothetical protein